MEGRRQWLPLLAIALGLLAVEASYGLCTQDDAFISFRYALNLVDGHGLVFNPGERVEGITNLLWTLLFVPFLALGMDPAPISASLGMVATLALLVVTWRMGGQRWLAVLLVAAVPGVSLEGAQGLETVAFAALVTAALCDRGRWAVWAGLAAWVRPEGVLVGGVLWLLRRDRRSLLVLAAMVGTLTAFRWGYYGDVVPNTFHAKVGGLAVGRGLGYAGDFAIAAAPLVLAGIAGMVIALRRREDRLLRDAAVLVAVYGAYVIAVGGDFKGTGRFLIPVVPALALLAQSVTWSDRRWRWGVGAAAVALALPGFRDMGHHAERFRTILAERRAVGELLDHRLPADAVIAIHSAGIVPYYARRTTIDMWGINDAHIARSPVTMGTGTAGHERHDYAYVLSRKPAVILPEAGLVTADAVDLGDPGVFGASFSDAYRSMSVPLAMGTLNLWRRVSER
jgi:arabinofuranosyltransferase